jgi:hypothetical protein
MAIEHDSIPNAELHEPKGADTATIGQIYVADGAGSGNWINTEGAKTVLVSSASDLPAAVAGVITLQPDTEYRLLTDVSIGTDRLVLADDTVIKGIDSLNVTLTYTGTGDMFTMADTTNRIAFLAISCISGTVFNWSCTSRKIFRCHDVTILTCDSVGTFTGVDGVIRFTTVSPAAIATSGCTFSGDFDSFLWEVSATTVNGGTLFDLGSATFDSFIADSIILTLGAGTTFLSGLTGSANIAAGGQGTITKVLRSGTGTILNNISVDDALWQFHLNDDIADTRADALSYMQGNATETVISGSSSDGSNAVLVAGTWSEETASQFTTTAAGRLTYDGGKNAKLPITASISIAPVSGNDVNISAYMAINGVVDSNSRRAATASIGDPTSITVPWQLVFGSSDYVELFVENNSNTTNLLVSSAIFRVN